jgi:hypothetical protein
MTEDKKYKRKKNVIQKGNVPMLSIKMISEKYHFHPQTIRNWVNRDGLKSVKHGQGDKVFIRQDDVEDFIYTWYGTPGIIGMAFPCKWLGCEEHVFIDYTVTGCLDYLPDGWQRLIISKNLLADKVMSAPHVSGYLCPKHYEELLSLLKKDEVEEQSQNEASGKEG